MSTTDSRTLRIERTFQAPIEAVFDAWTSAEVLRRWWQADRCWEKMFDNLERTLEAVRR